MNFYDTVGGRRFIDGTVPSLINAVKDLTKTITSKKRQYMVTVEPGTDAESVISGELEKGASYVAHFSDSKKIVFIFEEAENVL